MRAAPAQHAVDQLRRQARSSAPSAGRAIQRRGQRAVGVGAARPRPVRARPARAPCAVRGRRRGVRAAARPLRRSRPAFGSARPTAAVAAVACAGHARTVPGGDAVPGEHRRGRQPLPPRELQLAERDRAARAGDGQPLGPQAQHLAGPPGRCPSASASTTRGANSLSGAPSSIALAPGHGSTPRAWAETARAGRSKLEVAVGLGQHRRQRRRGVILRRQRDSCRPRSTAASRASSPAPERGELVGQRPGGVVVGDVERAHRRHRPGVEARLHAHDRHAGPRFAANDRPLDRRGAAQPGQQRRVHVAGPEPRQIEQLLRQDAAVGDDDEQIRGERRQRRLRLGRADLLGLQHGHAQRRRRDLHRGRRRRLPAPRRTIGLADDRDQRRSPAATRAQRRHRERGRAEENHPQRGRHGVRPSRQAALVARPQALVDEHAQRLAHHLADGVELRAQLARQRRIDRARRQLARDVDRAPAAPRRRSRRATRPSTSK